MIKKLPWLVFIIVFSLYATAQKVTISGYVDDKETGEFLIGASVYDTNNPSNGTSTNVYGFYSLTLPKGNINLTGSFVGFNSAHIDINLTKDTVINLSLSSLIILDEVVIDSKRDVVKDVQISKIDIPVQNIKKMPSLMGEADVMKAIQLLPGVQSGTEGMSGIYVRGGGPDQNLILLDGVPVYNVNHLFGFFSVFNGEAISDVSLIKGGFPARYGGRLSSVIDIRMKEGNMYEYKADASIGLIASRATVEGPLIKGKSSFILSARRTYLDVIAVPAELLYAKIKDNDPFVAAYYFHDLNAKVNYKISGTDRLYLSFYGGKDRAYGNSKTRDQMDNLTEESKFNLDWGNFVSAFRWNHIFTPKLFANTTATYTRFNYNIGQESFNLYYMADQEYRTDSKLGYYAGINDMAINTDFDWVINPDLKFRFGANATRHNFNPGRSAISANWYGQQTDTTYGYDNIFGNEYSAYLESEINIGKIISLNAGGRFAAYQICDTMFLSPEPRISARISVSDNFSVKLAYSRMQQNIHLLSNSTAGLPTDIWIPATNLILPQKATQYSGGFAFKLFDKLDLSVEGYYKKMTNQVEYKDGQGLFFSFVNTEIDDTQDLKYKVEQGLGWAYGTELFIQKNYGKLNGWLGYTLSWNNRQFETISFGEVFPYKYDRRHDFSIALNYKHNEKIDFGLSWVFSSGNNITIPGYSYMSGTGIEVYISNLISHNESYQLPVNYYGYRNNFKMPAYHRLDLGINFHKDLKHGARTWSINVYNAYCRLNPMFVEARYNQETGETTYWKTTMFPIIPSVSYSFKFK